jgi:hypothetical protein
MDPVTLLIVLALSVEIPAALVAVAYILYVQWPVRGQARFLDRLVKRDVRVALAGAAIGTVVAYNLFRFALPESGIPQIPPPWSSIIIGGALIVLLYGPIDDGLTLWRERRGR